MEALQYIEINKIEPHPDNPRKDLGDLTELAESIKINGILQNLTVVPWCNVHVSGSVVYDMHRDTYVAVIGHRRLAAAKLAGLETVPCIVAQMDVPAQMRMMLLENIQRSDLTVYEQAQGFQMMLDMGDSVEKIAKQSGFSESTIRRRVKLLDLDADKFKASEARGVTLADYMALDQVKDTARKNALLEHIGTENFGYELKRAVDDERNAENLAAVVAALENFATRVDSNESYRLVQNLSGFRKSPDEIQRPDDADETPYFFCVGHYGYIQLLKEKAAEPAEDSAERERRAQEEALREAQTNLLKDAAKRAYELRREFAAQLSTPTIRKHLPEILAFQLWRRDGNYINCDLPDVLELAGISADDPDNDAGEEPSLKGIANKIGHSALKVIWAMAYSDSGDEESEGYYSVYRREYEGNAYLDTLYDLLIMLGYEMSDEERALRDGTFDFSLEKEGDQK